VASPAKPPRIVYPLTLLSLTAATLFALLPATLALTGGWFLCTGAPGLRAFYEILVVAASNEAHASTLI
jgi:hypothetical protein